MSSSKQGTVSGAWLRISDQSYNDGVYRTLDNTVLGDNRQREITASLKILGSLPIPSTLQATVTLIEAHGKAFVPAPPPDVLIVR